MSRLVRCWRSLRRVHLPSGCYRQWYVRVRVRVLNLYVWFVFLIFEEVFVYVCVCLLSLACFFFVVMLWRDRFQYVYVIQFCTFLLTISWFILFTLFRFISFVRLSIVGSTTWQNLFPCLLNSQSNRDFFNATMPDEMLSDLVYMMATASVQEVRTYVCVYGYLIFLLNYFV